MAPGLATWGITSSEQLVQLLKQHEKNEKALPGAKIQILQSAWADEHVYVPKKAELLLDCALELVLASTRTQRSTGTPPFINRDYWAFLHTLLDSAHLDEESVHSAVARHPIFTLVAALCPHVTPDLWDDAGYVLAILLPAAIRRVGASQIDTVNACIRDLFHAMPAVWEPRHVSVTQHLWDTVCARWTPHLELGTNAKKTARFFVGETLVPWARAYAALDTADAASLRDAFSAVAARSLAPSPFDAAQLPDSVESLVPAVLEALDGPYAPALLCALPALLACLIEGPPRAHSSIQAPPPAVRQEALDQFVAPVCTALLARNDSLTTLWHLVEQIERLRLYQPGGDDHESWLALWSRLLRNTLAFLDATTDAETHCVCFEMSQALWRRESDLVRPVLSDLFVRMVPIRADTAAWPAALALVHTLLYDMAQERRMPELLSTLQATIDQACDASLDDAGTRLVHSPVLCYSTTLLWRRHLAQDASAAQAQDMWRTNLAHATRYASPPAPRLLGALHLLLLLALARPMPSAEASDLLTTCLGMALDRRAPPAIVAAALRLHTALARQGASLPMIAFDALSETLCIDAPSEVHVELIRAGLCHAERTQRLPPIPPLPALVRAGLEQPDTTWEGQVLGLLPPQVPLALWRLGTTRWAAVLDAYAPDALLQDLTHIFVATLAPGAPSHLATLSMHFLHQAHMLELPRWRLTLLAATLAALDRTTDTVSHAFGAVRLLTSVPTEYIGRDAARSLAPALWRWCTAPQWPDGIGAESSAGSELPRLLARWLRAYPGAPPLSLAAYLDTLVHGPGAHLSATACTALLTHSMELVDAFLACAPSAVCMPDVQAVLQRAPPGWGARVALYTQAHLLRSAVASRPAWAIELVPDDATLQRTLQETVVPLANVAADADVRDLACALDLITVQLELRAPALPLADARPCVVAALDAMVAAVHASSLSASHAAPLAMSLLRVLVALSLPPPALGVVVAQVQGALPTSDGPTSIWVKEVGRVSPDDYAHTLEALGAAFEPGTPYTASELAALLPVVALLLQHGAPGTGPAARTHLTALLRRLVVLVPHAPSVTLATVQLLERVCLNRVRILQAPDALFVLTVLGLVVGAHTDKAPLCEADASALFQSICATLRALVRQRKDLMRLCLPHLTDLVARLCLLLSSFVRAHPGEALVRDMAAALPAWLDVRQAPLTATDARALARLLSELGAKTSAGAPAAKRARLAPGATTESLRQPLSKYAVYMLLAYVRCVTMPHTTVAAALRAELQPGLLVLCDLCGEYERDAALKHALDASGQVVFQALWADWERQRYKGA
ncbi:hypothetical protein MNAN1_001739 [Malassezia nana]|uniref:Nucleolar 27S pre-rRNA processing Urb2/Npa2 C-terminal domain-containing protein n=1 Tax=Malassezia nana TaxID=180528 RepID=A0AAF0J281_9BASI|nr:hypothetical protein MNAN1_001739 [Malassezia nana]